MAVSRAGREAESCADAHSQMVVEKGAESDGSHVFRQPACAQHYAVPISHIMSTNARRIPLSVNRFRADCARSPRHYRSRTKRSAWSMACICSGLIIPWRDDSRSMETARSWSQRA